MKHLLALIICTTALSGCCDMAYGPSQCNMSDAEAQGRAAVAPAEPREPLGIAAPMPAPAPAPLVFMPAPQPAPQPQPQVVQAPFQMAEPSIPGWTDETGHAPAKAPAKPKAKKVKKAPAKAPAPKTQEDPNWLHP